MDNETKRIMIQEIEEGTILVGMEKPGCDPKFPTFKGSIPDNPENLESLDSILSQVPSLWKEALEHWAANPKNPAYKPPAPAPKPTTATASKPGKAEDLPLLAGAKPKEPEKAESVPQPETTGETASVPETKTTGEVEAEAPTTVGGLINKEDAVKIAEDMGGSREELEAREKATETPAQTATAGSKPATGWEYYLKDGRGPYPDIQKAMDDLGMPQDSRPHHTRWDRLSTQLKEQIQRKVKA